MDISFPTILLQTIGFLLFVLAMKKWLYRPVLSIIEDRQKRSQELLENAENYHHDAEQKFKKIQEDFAHAKKEIKILLDNAVVSAEQEKKIIIKQGEDRAAAFFKQAEENMKQEMQKTREELKNENVLFAISIAEKLLMKEISYEDRKNYVQFFLEDIKKNDEF